MAELHLGGSPSLVRAALARTVALGAVLAQPGEFKRRAFENAASTWRAGGVLALCMRATRTSAARRAHAPGGLSRRVELQARAPRGAARRVRGSLDFDEGDTARSRARSCSRSATPWLSRSRRRAPGSGARSSAGLPRAVLVGAPTPGSPRCSIGDRGAALVSDLPGTRAMHAARGARAASSSNCGTPPARQPVGGPSTDPDQLAQDRAAELRAAADLWLWVVDASLGPRDLRAEFAHLTGGQPAPPVVLVLHKHDLDPERAQSPASRARALGVENLVQGVVAASSKSGAGLEEVAREAERLLSSGGTSRGIAPRARHRQALDGARERLLEARDLLAGWLADRRPHALACPPRAGSIQGRTTPEDLRRASSSLCLGK